MRAKRIFLLIRPETAQGRGDLLDYKKLLTLQLVETNAGGMTVGQMKSRFALIDSLDAATDYWDLEYAAWDVLVKDLEKKKWGVVTKNIILFVDDLRDAPDAVAADNVHEFPVEQSANVE